jgi:hypothetical protein
VRVRRKPERADYGGDRVHAILDEALCCQVGVVRDGWPVVLPMAHGRDGDTVYLHGSAAAGLFRDMRGGSRVCVSATLLDGLVLARSARNHSMNYRSVTVFGSAVEVRDHAEKLHGLRVVVEHAVAGRWVQLREPTAPELDETGLWSVSLTEASAKVRTGPPLDPAEETQLPVWAGVLPLTPAWGEPVPAADLPAGVTPPQDPRRAESGRATA